MPSKKKKKTKEYSQSKWNWLKLKITAGRLRGYEVQRWLRLPRISVFDTFTTNKLKFIILLLLFDSYSSKVVMYPV